MMLEGKKAVVTGGSRGIGMEIVKLFLQEGASVTFMDLMESEYMGQYEALAKERGTSVVYKKTNVASEEEVNSVTKEILDEGNVDILVNNAGIALLESVVNLQPEHWDAVLNVNLRAPALISKVIANHMIANGKGAIVNVSSAAGVTALKEHAAYCASKYGLIGLSQVMAVELGPHNIRVNVVAPTVVMTEMGIQVWSDPAKSEPMLAKIPLNRFAEPINIADAVMFLASEEASMINGVVLCVDGGYTAQ